MQATATIETNIVPSFDLFGNLVSSSQNKKKFQVKKDDVNWIDIKRYWDIAPESKMTFVDLFCGAGGLSKGLEMAGLQGICGLDWFDEAGKTYRRNFDHPFVNGDIKLAEKKEEFYYTVRQQSTFALRTLSILSTLLISLLPNRLQLHLKPLKV